MKDKNINKDLLLLNINNRYINHESFITKWFMEMQARPRQ